MSAIKSFIDEITLNTQQERDLIAKIGQLQRELESMRARNREQATYMADFAFIASMNMAGVQFGVYADRMKGYVQNATSGADALRIVYEKLEPQFYAAIDRRIREQADHEMKVYEPPQAAQ